MACAIGVVNPQRHFLISLLGKDIPSVLLRNLEPICQLWVDIYLAHANVIGIYFAAQHIALVVEVPRLIVGTSRTLARADTLQGIR